MVSFEKIRRLGRVRVVLVFLRDYLSWECLMNKCGLKVIILVFRKGRFIVIIGREC